MALDLKKWLTDEMGFSEAEAAEMLPKFSGDRAGKLEAGYASAGERASIAAARQDLSNAQTALKASNDKLNAEIQEWANLTSAEKEQSTGLRESLHKREQEVLALTQTVNTIAAQAGIDPKTVLPDLTKVEPKVEAKTTPIDTSQFVQADQFGTLMQFAVDLPASLQFIAEQHRELTGKSLDTRTIVAEVKKRAGQKDAVVDPVQIWEEMHNIPALRTQRDDAARASEIAAAEARGEERARTNMAIPGAHLSRSTRPSPVLGQRQSDGHMAPRTSVFQRPQPESTVMAAAAAFRSGKYAGKASA